MQEKRRRLSGRTVLVFAFLAFAAATGTICQAGETTIDSLAWMAGTWTGESGSLVQEEHWTAPGGGIMLGIHRDTRPGKKAFFEFLRIEEQEEGIFYIASPRGKPGVPFKLISSEGKKAVFSNPEHDSPHRIIYWLGEEGALHARIETDTPGGEVQSMEWAWKRAE